MVTMGARVLRFGGPVLRSTRPAGPRTRAVVGGANIGERLPYGHKLLPNGDELWSADLVFKAWLPADGNLAVDQAGRAQQWRAGVQFPNPAYAVLAPDGELAVFDTNGVKRWSNGLHADPSQLDPAGLLLQTDGNLVLYDAAGVQGGRARWASQLGLSHSVLPQWAQDALGVLHDVTNTLHIAGFDFVTAIASGEDPIAALKEEGLNAIDSAQLAAAVASGNVPAAVAKLASMSPVALPSDVVAAAQTVLSQPGALDPKAALDFAISQAQQAPAGLASLVQSADYAKAWDLATSGGKLFDAALPAPPGRSYAVAVATSLPGAAASSPRGAPLGPAPAPVAVAPPTAAPGGAVQPWGKGSPVVTWAPGQPLVVRF